MTDNTRLAKEHELTWGIPFKVFRVAANHTEGFREEVQPFQCCSLRLLRLPSPWAVVMPYSTAEKRLGGPSDR